jgi:Tol biopolymer transport system component
MRTLPIQRNSSNVPLTWAPDGRAIDASDPHDGNVWRYPIDGTTPRRLTNFTGGRIRALAWSPDGQRLAVSRGIDRADVVLLTNIQKP